MVRRGGRLKDEIQDIKEQVTVAQVITSLGGEVMGNSWDRWLKTRCPFHGYDANPSASVNLSEGRFYCHTCDVHGDVIDLAMRELHTADIRHAINWLRRKFL